MTSGLRERGKGWILDAIVSRESVANNTVILATRPSSPTPQPIQPKSQNMIEPIEGILEFWFGRGQTALAVADEKTALWWSKSDPVDREITERFAATTAAVADGQLDHWAESPRGLLALILCTDQFPRNMYRDTPAAFAFDRQALSLAKRCVACAPQLAPIERVFAYLPFEHSEELAEQQRAVALYRALADEVGAAEAELFEGYCEFADRHYQIIERFGRFPHRNRILGRRSTDEERAFLEQPGSSF